MSTIEELEKKFAQANKQAKKLEDKKTSLMLGRPELGSVDELLEAFEPINEVLLSHIGYNTLREFIHRVHCENKEALQCWREVYEKRLAEQDSMVKTLAMTVDSLSSNLAQLGKDFNEFTMKLTRQNETRIQLLKNALAKIEDELR